MAESNKKEVPHFLNEKGELDFAKLMQTDPDLLSSFINQREDDEEGGGEDEGGTQHLSMSFALGMAALRDAMGLSMSYAPLNGAEQIRDMSMSAQVNLGIEASQGLSMDMGRGSATNPFGSAEDAPTDKKDKANYKKKLKGL